MAVFGFFAIMVVGSLHINDLSIRHTVIGLLSTASLVSMFASPLFIIVSLSLYGPFGSVCNNSDLGKNEMVKMLSLTLGIFFPQICKPCNVK